MATKLIFSILEKPPIEARMLFHPQAMVAAYGAEGELWAETMLPGHFTPQAHNLYGFQVRAPSTLRRKRATAILGGLIDLVWTGLLMRAVLGYQAVVPNERGVTVRMFGPKYLYPFDKRKNQPDKAAEVLRVMPFEQVLLEGRLDDTYHDQVNSVRATKVTTIGKGGA